MVLRPSETFYRGDRIVRIECRAAVVEHVGSYEAVPDRIDVGRIARNVFHQGCGFIGRPVVVLKFSCHVDTGREYFRKTYVQIGPYRIFRHSDIGCVVSVPDIEQALLVGIVKHYIVPDVLAPSVECEVGIGVHAGVLHGLVPPVDVRTGS